MIKRANKHCLPQSTLKIAYICAHTHIHTNAPQKKKMFGSFETWLFYRKPKTIQRKQSTELIRGAQEYIEYVTLIKNNYLLTRKKGTGMFKTYSKYTILWDLLVDRTQSGEREISPGRIVSSSEDSGFLRIINQLNTWCSSLGQFSQQCN